MNFYKNLFQHKMKELAQTMFSLDLLKIGKTELGYPTNL